MKSAQDLHQFATRGNVFNVKATITVKILSMPLASPTLALHVLKTPSVYISIKLHTAQTELAYNAFNNLSAFHTFALADNVSTAKPQANVHQLHQIASITENAILVHQTVNAPATPTVLQFATMGNVFSVLKIQNVMEELKYAAIMNAKPVSIILNVQETCLTAFKESVTNVNLTQNALKVSQFATSTTNAKFVSITKSAQHLHQTVQMENVLLNV